MMNWSDLLYFCKKYKTRQTGNIFSLSLGIDVKNEFRYIWLQTS